MKVYTLMACNTGVQRYVSAQSTEMFLPDPPSRFLQHREKTLGSHRDLNLMRVVVFAIYSRDHLTNNVVWDDFSLSSVQGRLPSVQDKAFAYNMVPLPTLHGKA